MDFAPQFPDELARHLCPGGGDIDPFVECGSVAGSVRCGCGVSPRLIVSGCRNKGCPICWPRWAQRAVREAVVRVVAHMTAVRARGDVLLPPRHVILSPHPGKYAVPQNASLQDKVVAMRKFSRRAGRLQRSLGLAAAVGVDHPYRILKANHTRRVGVGDDVSDVRRFTVYNRETVARSNRYRAILDGPDEGLSSLILSPHRHLIIFGPLPDSAAFFKRTGWVIRLVRNAAQLRREPLDDVGMVEARLRYLLSHSWVWGNGKVLRYYGGLQRHPEYVIRKDTAVVADVCDVCGGGRDVYTGTDTDGYGGVFTKPHMVRATLYSLHMSSRGCRDNYFGYSVIDFLGYLGYSRVPIGGNSGWLQNMIKGV